MWWIDHFGNIYGGDCNPGDREATQAEYEDWRLPIELAAKKTAIANQYNAALSDFTGYPVTETLSWYQQAKEAEAYVASNGATIGLFLTAYEANRGTGTTELPDFVQAILTKAAQFAAVAGELKGKKSVKELEWNTLIAAYHAGTKTFDDVQAFDPTYLPYPQI